MTARRVLPPDLKKYFRFHLKYFSFTNNLSYNSQIFNPFAFFVFCIFFFICIGFFKPLAWSVALALTMLLLFLYFKTARLAKGIVIQRKVPKRAREREEISVLYTISNETGFRLGPFEFYEKFEGVERGEYKVSVKNSIPGGIQKVLKRQVLLNNGMGIKDFSPLEINFSDELGLFPFRIQFREADSIEVYPCVETIPSLKVSVTDESHYYGQYEVAKRGSTDLFIGTRAYRAGDPVKYINWKLSKKRQELVINEFEKSTNTFVTFLLELGIQNQVGSGSLSTWEGAKDLALSLIQNEINRQNHVQVASSELYIPFGTGPSQMQTIEKHFTLHEMTKGEEKDHFSTLHLPLGSQLYFICPMLTTRIVEETLQKLKLLSGLQVSVTIFFLDPYTDLLKGIKGDSKNAMMEMERISRIAFAKYAEEFHKTGAKTIVIDVTKKPTVTIQLKQKGKGILEVKA